MTSTDRFNATVESAGWGSAIRMRGTVDRAAIEKLDAAYEEACEHPGEIRLDFNDVDYINSTGIALIVGLLARARSTGKLVGAFGLTDHYREVFEITRLSDFMHIYDDANMHNR